MDMSLHDQITANLRRLSAERGTTPTAVARDAGIISSTLHAKLQGRTRWNTDDLETLSAALDVTPADLVSVISPVLVELPHLDSSQKPTVKRWTFIRRGYRVAPRTIVPRRDLFELAR